MPLLPYKITKRRKESTQNRAGRRWWRYKKSKLQPTTTPLSGNVQPGVNNSENEGASQGNGDGSGNEGSQQPLLNPYGSTQQGTGDSNSESQQGGGSGSENNNQEAQQTMSGGNQEAHNDNGSGNQAANDGNAGGGADHVRPGKWAAIKGFLAVRVENFRARLQRLGEVLAAPRPPGLEPDGLGTP